MLDSSLTRVVLAASVLFVVLVNGARSISAEPLEVVEYNVVHKFIGKGGEAARDLSGIACAPGDSARRCLVIDDEGDSAQWATLDGTSLIAEDQIPLIGESEDDVTFGTSPDVECANGEVAFGDLDGEAVAFAAPYFYVVGSHGCSRKNGEYSASAFALARLSTAQQDGVETTFRLTDVLRHASTVSAFFGKDLNSENGLNIEGLAVQGNQLVIGLACAIHSTVWPSSCGPISVRCLQRVHDPELPSSKTFPIAVPEGTGIRDLTTLPDGRLLLLLGPAQEQALPLQPREN